MEDYFGVKPYSFEVYGDLKKYLEEHNGMTIDNLFYSFKYFCEIQTKGFMIPKRTLLRVNESPIPDAVYFVDEKFLLESEGRRGYNMSAVEAKKGVYSPKEILSEKLWSIYNLNLN